MTSSKRLKNRIRGLKYRVENIDNLLTRGFCKLPVITNGIIRAPKKLKGKKTYLKKQKRLLNSAIKNHKYKLFQEIFKVREKFVNNMIKELEEEAKKVREINNSRK